jgi:hypothetical protein
MAQRFKGDLLLILKGSIKEVIVRESPALWAFHFNEINKK